MPFLAPLAGAGIGGGASILSSLLGSKLAGGMNPEQKAAQAGLAQGQNLGLQNSQNLMGLGRNALNPSMNYWSSLLSGNRDIATSAIAPEANMINEAANAQRQNQAMLMPRGGGRASFLTEQPYRTANQIQSLFQNLRPQAAQNLGAQGMGLIGQGTNALQASTAAGRDILAAQQAERARQAEQGGKIGSGLFSMFQQYGMPALQSQFPSLFPEDQNKS